MKSAIIAQEIDALKRLVDRSREQIELLQELKVMAHKSSSPIGNLQKLQQKLPLISDMEVDEKIAPTCSSGDFYIQKAVVPLDHEATLVKFLPLRNPRTAAGGNAGGQPQVSLPSTFLVVASPDGMIKLFTQDGEWVLTFSTGHELPVEHVAVSPSNDEYLILTGDNFNTIRLHKIGVRHRRSPKQKRGMKARMANNERTSPYLGLQYNVTAQYNKQLRLPNSTLGERKMTTLTAASQQGTKYFIAGDSLGYINIFTRNGTLKAEVDTMPVNSSAPRVPIDSVNAHLGQFMYRAGTRWGMVDIEHEKVKHRRFKCPRFEGEVSVVITDGQQNSKVIVADEAGTVWVFNLKEKRECQVEHRFAKGSTRGPLDLAAVRGYVIAVEERHRGHDLVVLNSSHVGVRKSELSEYPSPVVFRRKLGSIRTWSAYKRYQQGDLIAFLSADGMQVEFAELLMSVYKQPEMDNFNSFKMPLIAVAVCCILGYQYMKGSGGGGGDEAGGGGGGIPGIPAGLLPPGMPGGLAGFQ